MKYKVALRHSEEGFSVSCPGLPGCWSQGGTEEEPLANIREAIREYLEARDAAMKDGETREIEVHVEPRRSFPASIISKRFGLLRRLGFAPFVGASTSWCPTGSGLSPSRATIL